MRVDFIDDDVFVLALCVGIARSAGWSVRTFSSGSQFLDAASARMPDCVVLDLQMPDMNGADLLERLTAACCTFPVVVVTSAPDSPLAALARKAGACKILSKPFSSEDLLEAVEGCVARTSWFIHRD